MGTVQISACLIVARAVNFALESERESVFQIFRSNRGGPLEDARPATRKGVQVTREAHHSFFRVHRGLPVVISSVPRVSARKDEFARRK